MGHSLLHLLRGRSKFFFPLRTTSVIVVIRPLLKSTQHIVIIE